MRKFLNVYIVFTFVYAAFFVMLFYNAVKRNGSVMLLNSFLLKIGFLFPVLGLAGLILFFWIFVLRIMKRMELRTFLKYGLLLLINIVSLVVLFKMILGTDD